MNPISRRTVIRTAGVALALPFVESMVPAQALLARVATSTRSSRIVVPRSKYRRLPISLDGGFSHRKNLAMLVEDEVGVRYGISKDKMELLRYGPIFIGQSLRWETLKSFKGAYATAMTEEIMASIKESEEAG